MVVEDDDAALFRLRLLGIHHGCAHYVVSVSILPEASAHQRRRKLILHQLVRVEYCVGKVGRERTFRDLLTLK